MALQVQTFTEFTPSMFTAFVAKIKNDTGTEITKNKGTVVHGGFTFTYSYDPTTQTLQVQCLKKPLFLSQQTILNGMSEEILEVKSQVLNAPAVVVDNVKEPVPVA